MRWESVILPFPPSPAFLCLCSFCPHQKLILDQTRRCRCVFAGSGLYAFLQPSSRPPPSYSAHLNRIVVVVLGRRLIVVATLLSLRLFTRSFTLSRGKGRQWCWFALPCTVLTWTCWLVILYVCKVRGLPVTCFCLVASRVCVCFLLFLANVQRTITTHHDCRCVITLLCCARGIAVHTKHNFEVCECVCVVREQTF